MDWTSPFWQADQAWLLYDMAGTTSATSNFTVQVEDWLDGTGQQSARSFRGPSFSIRQTGQDVELVYTVPEPSSPAVVAAGVCLLAVRSSTDSSRPPSKRPHFAR